MSCEDGFNLNDSKTYFSEYVLEQSDTKGYFKKHVVGFTFESTEDDDSHNGENMNTTVWYSNKVSMLPTFIW